MRRAVEGFTAGGAYCSEKVEPTGVVDRRIGWVAGILPTWPRWLAAKASRFDNKRFLIPKASGHMILMFGMISCPEKGKGAHLSFVPFGLCVGCVKEEPTMHDELIVPGARVPAK